MRCGVDSVVEWPSACWRSACRRFDSCHRTALILPYPFPLYSRSIPVHTGKPSVAYSRTLYGGVYPRTHGETPHAYQLAHKDKGLSPYTRGNLLQMRDTRKPSRSIPVHTGKPRIALCIPIQTRVYPRTHGETAIEYTPEGRPMGLSPYTRGNQILPLSGRERKGSIPVHTGKPCLDLGADGVHEVYPRTHGETQWGQNRGIPRGGLSPYTRGNPAYRAMRTGQTRSIPVHTGKPLRPFASSSFQVVYPRTHGETLP